MKQVVKARISVRKKCGRFPQKRQEICPIKLVTRDPSADLLFIGSPLSPPGFHGGLDPPRLLWSLPCNSPQLHTITFTKKIAKVSSNLQFLFFWGGRGRGWMNFLSHAIGRTHVHARTERERGTKSYFFASLSSFLRFMINGGWLLQWAKKAQDLSP